MDWIKDYWPIITSFFGILLYTWRIRSIEVTKIRVQSCIDAFATLSELNSAVQLWAHPMGELAQKNAQLHEKLQKIWPEAERAINKASLVIAPHKIDRMKEVFRKTNEMLAEHASWQMFLDSNKNADGAYTQEIQKTHKRSKKELPQEISEVLSSILRDFQKDLNGHLTVRLWEAQKNCGCCE